MMSLSCSHLPAPLFQLSSAKARDYCFDVLMENGQLLDLGHSRDAAFMVSLVAEAKSTFSDVLEMSKERLGDKSCGIVGIDIPTVFEDVTDDAIAGAFMSVALTTALIDPAKDLEI